MKQVLQELGTGKTLLAEVPAPATPRNGLSIATSCSLISAGTERMLVEFGRAGWFDKMRQQPDKVLQVLDKIRTDGLMPTIEAVRSKLDQPVPLGYCNVGVVAAVGADVSEFSAGDRVVSNGPHAEFVAVPRNLCARVPADVPDEAAAFTVVGAIGLQGIRLAAPTLGESFVVTGLGLIGLITVQLLRANGCRVLGIDPDPRKAELARRFGAETVAIDRGEDPLAAAEAFSRGQGVDGVLITASTKSNEPVSQGAKMCRQRGRIVLVGVAGLELDRADFYTKELSFQVSCSYGPGRYDPEYEEKGNDYPLGFVRWTEQRNFEAVLAMMQSGALDLKPLITHRFAFDDAARAYELLSTNAEPYLGILIEYAGAQAPPVLKRTLALDAAPLAQPMDAAQVAFLGAGNYAGRVLIPAFAAAGAKLVGISSGKGVTAAHFGRKFRFARATTDSQALIDSADVNVIAIATRHDSHAHYTIAAMRAGKHVFVEKPLAITLAELDAVAAARADAVAAGRTPLVMVGFNRRFAPQIAEIKRLIASNSAPKNFIVTVNAGAIPATHWTQDPAVGGGRIIGEGCHFIDLLRFLAGAPIEGWDIRAQHTASGPSSDNVSIILRFGDGSVGTIQYIANGHSSFPKERIEVFCAGRVLQLDNFRKLHGFGWSGVRAKKLWRQDKGQQACAAAFLDAVRAGGESPIPFEQLMEVSRVSIEIGEAARR